MVRQQSTEQGETTPSPYKVIKMFKSQPPFLSVVPSSSCEVSGEVDDDDNDDDHVERHTKRYFSHQYFIFLSLQ